MSRIDSPSNGFSYRSGDDRSGNRGPLGQVDGRSRFNLAVVLKKLPGRVIAKKKSSGVSSRCVEAANSSPARGKKSVLMKSGLNELNVFSNVVRDRIRVTSYEKSNVSTDHYW